MVSKLVIINYLSFASGWFPVLAGFYNYRKLSANFRFILLFFSISALFDLAFLLTEKLGYRNNLPLLHLFILTGIVFFSIIYVREFHKTFLKRLCIVLAAAALGSASYSAIWGNGIWAYPSLGNTLFSIFMITISLFYFYEMLRTQEFVYIEKQGMFWINSGVLIYFAINIFLFMLFSRIMKENIKNLYAIHDISNIIANCLYSIGLLCKPPKTA
ncbi:hypothetical protein GS399_16725 [Pedobacter sp. HMF7647]|uniref:Uncharacterized protein n=1 Tax=Hufsiella arboris TaxID=2695275 RepID=A0A7K1YDZ0_9SPHI|nr:hypothetical protein [Hufsiella arboris]MXV52620.1 hypothetical protein [Hufsiella arboris]